MDPNVRKKRTSVACTLCRKRKRRCDGVTPSCKLCTDSGSDCTYPVPEDTTSKEDRLLEPLISRLDSLHENLRRQTALLGTLNDRVQTLESNAAGTPGGGGGTALPAEHTSTPSTSLLSPLSFRDSAAAASTPQSHGRVLLIDGVPLDLDVGRALPPMTIPIGHCTTTASLLSLQVVRAILGDFPDDIFVRTEEARHMPPEMQLNGPLVTLDDLPAVDPLQAEVLIDSYFDHGHGEAPVLDRGEFLTLHHRLQLNTPGLNVESALYFIVLALGCAFASEAGPKIQDAEPPSGAEYAVPALRILVQEYLVSYGSSVMLSQGLFLAARYFAFFLCPLQSWKLVHMASTNIQHQFSKFSQEHDFDEAGPQTNLIVWAIFDAECNLIAEHQLPRSGIEQIVDRMALPSSHAGGDHESHAMLNWLAELAVRRLLNRVHHTMYGADAAMHTIGTDMSSTASSSSPSMLTVLKVSSELNQQLDVWFQTLPPMIRPDLGSGEYLIHGPFELHLLHRYHSAKDIIFRPFVFSVYCAPEPGALPDLVLEKAGMCLQHCRSYLSVAERLLPLPSTTREIIMHSVFSATVMLTLGFLSPPLTPLVEDIEHLQDTAISCLGHFAYPGSSVETMFWILQTLKTKTRMMSNNRSMRRVLRSSVST